MEDNYSPGEISPGTNHRATNNRPDYLTAVLFTGAISPGDYLSVVRNPNICAMTRAQVGLLAMMGLRLGFTTSVH